MAGVARTTKADSAQSQATKTAKPRKSARLEKSETLMLDDTFRVDDLSGSNDIPEIDDAQVRHIAAAFARNKIADETIPDSTEGLVGKEKADAARLRMRELLQTGAPLNSHNDDRISRAQITVALRDIDAQLEQRLRELVRETVQEMLGGDTGQKMSSGIRRMVRREVEMMIALERAS